MNLYLTTVKYYQTISECNSIAIIFAQLYFIDG